MYVPQPEQTVFTVPRSEGIFLMGRRITAGGRLAFGSSCSRCTLHRQRRSAAEPETSASPAVWDSLEAAEWLPGRSHPGVWERPAEAIHSALPAGPRARGHGR